METESGAAGVTGSYRNLIDKDNISNLRLDRLRGHGDRVLSAPLGSCPGGRESEILNGELVRND